MYPSRDVPPPAGADQSVPADIVIDLDLAAPPGSPAAARRPRPHPRLLLILAVALALLLGGATVPGPAPLAPLFRVASGTAAAYVLRDRVLYVADSRQVAAYRVPDGRLLWRSAAAGAQVIGMWLDEPTDALVVTVSGPSIGTRVLEAATGALRWERADLISQPVPGTELLFGQTQELEPGNLTRVLLLSLRDGQPRWQQQVRPEWLRVGLDGANQPDGGFLLLDADGLTVRVRDGMTGEQVSAGTLTDRQPELAHAVTYLVDLVGRMVLAVGLFPDSAVAYAFDAASLAPLWQTRLPGYLRFANRCGSRLCLSGDTGVAMLDPATGALLGEGAWRWLWELPGGALLADAETGVTVLDAALSARQRMPGTQLVSFNPVLLARQADDGPGIWLATVDGVTARQLVLGRAPIEPVDSCQVDSGFLACWASGHGVSVSRLPAGLAFAAEPS